MYSRTQGSNTVNQDSKNDAPGKGAPVQAGDGLQARAIQPTFNPGDRVMVPPYGIGTVCETLWREVAGNSVAYYAVEFPQTSSRAFVPVHTPSSSGMRAALTSREMPRLLKHLKDGQLDLPAQWSARQRQVTEILVSGDPFDLATLTSELRRWNVERGLPDLDRQAFRRAIKLLEQEVGGLQDQQAVQVRELLERALGEGVQ